MSTTDDQAAPIPSIPPYAGVRICSDPLVLAGTRAFVSGVAERLGFGEQHRSQLALAVDEALCNVMRHGYDRRADGPIWISLWPLDTGDAALPADKASAAAALLIVIEDEARQVDPDQIRSRCLEDIRPGGLGVHIIRETMDVVRYERRDGTGMRLTIIKRKSPPPATNGGAQPQ
jgi:anti-sigma regulatory factor (Ser/Thr protein kinase)